MTGKGGSKKTWFSTWTFPPIRTYAELCTSSCKSKNCIIFYANLEPAEIMPLHIQPRSTPKHHKPQTILIRNYYISHFWMMLRHHCHRLTQLFWSYLDPTSNPGPPIENLHRNCQVQHHEKGFCGKEWHLATKCQWPTRMTQISFHRTFNSHNRYHLGVGGSLTVSVGLSTEVSTNTDAPRSRRKPLMAMSQISCHSGTGSRTLRTRRKQVVILIRNFHKWCDTKMVYVQ